MEINKILAGNIVTLAPSGRLDTNTSPEFAKAANAVGDDVKKPVHDFAELSYISSAGLRVILFAQKK